MKGGEKTKRRVINVKKLEERKKRIVVKEEVQAYLSRYLLAPVRLLNVAGSTYLQIV